jgi:hypothetical protein
MTTTIWVLIIFFHDVPNGTAESQLTVAVYSSYEKCNETRNMATVNRSDIRCLGVDKLKNEGLYNYDPKKWF